MTAINEDQLITGNLRVGRQGFAQLAWKVSDGANGQPGLWGCAFDPSVAGFAAPAIGDIAIRTDVPQLWQRVGLASTDWTMFSASGGAPVFTSAITVGAFSVVDDYTAPGIAEAFLVRQNTDPAGSLINGIDPLAGALDSRLLLFRNLGPGPLTFAHEALTAAADARCSCPGSVDATIPVNGLAWIFRDDTSQRFLVFPTPAAPAELSITNLGPARSRNLSTEGTLDWFALVTANVQLRDVTNTNWKILGLGVYVSFNFWTRGQGTLTTFPVQQTSNASDTVNNAPLTANANAGGVSTPNATLGYGFNFVVPASPNQSRDCVCMINVANGTATVTAVLDDGTQQQLTVTDAIGGTSAEVLIRFRASGFVRVSIVMTAQTAGTKVLSFQNMTLAPTP